MEAILGRKIMSMKGLIVLVAIMVCAFYTSAASKEKSQNKLLEGEETAPYASYELIQDTIVLDGKGDDYVLFCRRKFEIKSFTVIRNQFGMGIALGDVPVPCEALVVYFKKPGEDHTYITVSIEVRGIPTPQPE